MVLTVLIIPGFDGFEQFNQKQEPGAGVGESLVNTDTGML